MLLESQWVCCKCGDRTPCKLGITLTVDRDAERFDITRPMSCPIGLHTNVCFTLKSIDISESDTQERTCN